MISTEPMPLKIKHFIAHKTSKTNYNRVSCNAKIGIHVTMLLINSARKLFNWQNG